MVTKSWLSKLSFVNLTSAQIYDSFGSVGEKTFESFIMLSQSVIVGQIRYKFERFLFVAALSSETFATCLHVIREGRDSDYGVSSWWHQSRVSRKYWFGSEDDSEELLLKWRSVLWILDIRFLQIKTSLVCNSFWFVKESSGSLFCSSRSETQCRIRQVRVHRVQFHLRQNISVCT